MILYKKNLQFTCCTTRRWENYAMYLRAEQRLRVFKKKGMKRYD
jgi:hypothetical protein